MVASQMNENKREDSGWAAWHEGATFAECL